jgi:hypothetical protein
VKVIGRELEEQKVTGLVSVLHSREFGSRILYDSITSSVTLPMEQLSIAAMRPRQTSCSPWGTGYSNEQEKGIELSRNANIQ